MQNNLAQIKLFLLHDFFDKASHDPLVSSTHVSLYCALLSRSIFERDMLVTRFYRFSIVPLARIEGKATFYKCISTLIIGNYLCYQPSKNSRIESAVFFMLNHVFDHHKNFNSPRYFL